MSSVAEEDRAPGLDVGDSGSVGLYEAIHSRRDVRGQFTGEPIDPEVLSRMLSAAHAAPSVGLTQPWDFILVRDPEIRRAFYDHVQEERRHFAESLTGEVAERFSGIKIDGVLEATLSVMVTYDAARGAPNVLGRGSIADAGLYSVCLAIENLWLASTAEGMGMGWVSFYRERFVSELLGIPEDVRPVAWLCLGPVTHLESTPDLERHGWRQRTPLEAALHYDRWDAYSAPAPAPSPTAAPAPSPTAAPAPSPTAAPSPAASRSGSGSGSRSRPDGSF